MHTLHYVWKLNYTKATFGDFVRGMNMNRGAGSRSEMSCNKASLVPLINRRAKIYIVEDHLRAYQFRRETGKIPHECSLHDFLSRNIRPPRQCYSQCQCYVQCQSSSLGWSSDRPEPGRNKLNVRLIQSCLKMKVSSIYWLVPYQKFLVTTDVSLKTQRVLSYYPGQGALIAKIVYALFITNRWQVLGLAPSMKNDCQSVQQPTFEPESKLSLIAWVKIKEN